MNQFYADDQSHPSSEPCSGNAECGQKRGCFAIKVPDRPAGIAKGVDLVYQVFIFRTGVGRLSRLILAYMLGEPDSGMQPGKRNFQVSAQDRA